MPNRPPMFPTLCRGSWVSSTTTPRSPRRRWASPSAPRVSPSATRSRSSRRPRRATSPSCLGRRLRGSLAP
eukprot:15440190-Alexandrium_andersonii.AAC.1